MFFVGDLDERIKKAKKRAREVFYRTSDNLEDHLLGLRFVICDRWDIPLFSKYFDDRTIDDLIFEAEMIYLSRMPEENKTTDVVKEMRKDSEKGEKTELDSLFDDMIEEESAKPKKTKGWVNWGGSKQVATSNTELDEMEKMFLESGNLPGDK